MKRKNKKIFGEMAERSNAAVLKTVEVKASGGSNPSLSATQREVVASLFVWRRERVTKKHRGSDKERSDNALPRFRAQRGNGSISLSAKKHSTLQIYYTQREACASLFLRDRKIFDRIYRPKLLFAA